ncbi:hypothetical protein [Streptomyces sp. CRN 30]|uniref:hypothetical protein n=1 Tax=Streptomyces sp. CRN 30 TaxID=3075613 RepID=UPI002A825CFD|nr:hypothetical protein [Streptomyces sp. CRN 30]
MGVTAVVALTAAACGGGGSSDDSPPDGTEPGTTASTPSAPSSPSPSPSAGGSEGSAGELEGSWLATTGGKAVALVVTGARAGLFATGGTVCGGSTGERDGARTIRLSCTDGDDARKSGTVESVDASRLVVDWAGGLGTETYTKAEGGTLPSGLPTAGLGSAG